MEFEAIVLADAKYAAQEATDKFLAERGDGAFCGFAWVKIRPANHRFARWLKKQSKGKSLISGYGRLDDYEGGWYISVYDICNYRGQSMDVKEAACRAFVAKVKEAYPGINCYSATRPD